MFPKELGIIIEDVLFDVILLRFRNDFLIELVHSFMALFIEIHGLQHVDRKFLLSDVIYRYLLLFL